MKANSVTWWERWHCSSFRLSWHKKCNDAIDDAASIMWHWCKHQWCYMTEKSCCPSFQLSWPRKWNCSIDDAIGITWSQWQCHCHLAKKLYRTSCWSSRPKKCNATIDLGICIPWYWHQCHWLHVVLISNGIQWQKCYVALISVVST